jgi:hypothetical protein
MTRLKIARLTAAGLALAAFAAPHPAAAASASPDTVDRSRLVPALSPTFVPWTCKMKATGPVCDGERHLSSDWAPADIPCDVPLWNKRVEDRYQTRYYDHDYLNYNRKFRTNDVDYFSTTPSGPATATIKTNGRWVEPFAVRGNDQTITVISKGTLWDIRSAHGPAVFRAVGTLVEPYDAPPTFSGHVTVEGVTTTYLNAPLDAFLDDDRFLSWVCEAATAGH